MWTSPQQQWSGAGSIAATDEFMLAITKSRKWVAGLGQRVFARKTSTIPHVSLMICFNAEGVGPIPMRDPESSVRRCTAHRAANA